MAKWKFLIFGTSKLYSISDIIFQTAKRAIIFGHIIPNLFNVNTWLNLRWFSVYHLKNINLLLKKSNYKIGYFEGSTFFKSFWSVIFYVTNDQTSNVNSFSWSRPFLNNRISLYIFLCMQDKRRKKARWSDCLCSFEFSLNKAFVT